MSAPPIPPRPNSSYDGGYPARQNSNPPPLPPLPPNFHLQESPPHFQDPVLAPRPQRLMQSVQADVRETIRSWHVIRQPLLQCLADDTITRERRSLLSQWW